MTHPPLTAQRLQGIVLAIVISTLFGAAWGLNGSAALGGMWRWIVGAIVVALTLALLLTANAFRRNTQHLPSSSTDASANPFRNTFYVIAVVAEIIAIPVAARLLTAAGRSDAIISAVALIVGLHFFGLIPAFRSWIFAWVGGAFCVLALASLAVPAQIDGGIALRTAVVGLGCALILWLGVVPIVVQTRRYLAGQRMA